MVGCVCELVPPYTLRQKEHHHETSLFHRSLVCRLWPSASCSAAPAASRRRTTASMPPSSNARPRPPAETSRAPRSPEATRVSATAADASRPSHDPGRYLVDLPGARGQQETRPAQRHRQGHRLGQVDHDEHGQDRSQEAGPRRSEVDELDQVLRREPGRKRTTATARRKSAATSTTSSRRTATCRPPTR